MSRRNATNSGMSLARRQRLAVKKRRKQVAVLYSECSLCGFLVAGKTKPLVTARMLDHYKERHRYVIEGGGIPIIGTLGGGAHE